MVYCTILEDSFWVMGTALAFDVTAPFKSMEEDENHTHQTLSGDHREDEVVVSNPRSILHMCIEKIDAAWTDLRFDQKCKATSLMMLSAEGYSHLEKFPKTLKVSVKPLDCSRIISISRDHQNLACVISWWSVECHTFIATRVNLGRCSRM